MVVGKPSLHLRILEMNDDTTEKLSEQSDPHCPGCKGGDLWPISEDYWICPVCDTEYFTEDDDGKTQHIHTPATGLLPNPGSRCSAATAEPDAWD